jgi:hypothetical protein
LVHEVGKGPLNTGHHRPCACAKELEQEADHFGLSERATAIAVVVWNAQINEGVHIWLDHITGKRRVR